MGRKTRQHYPGAFYHLIARGNDRQPIFLGGADRQEFERLLKDGVERFGHQIHAYCWMTNHVHLAVEVAELPLSQIAHNLLFRYARWFNRQHGRSGHLFDRRYRAPMIRSTASLQSLVRYIHLNPVRAAIVERPDEYPWSSSSTYSVVGSPGPSWLSRELVLSLFGDTPATARAALRAFTELEVEDGEEDTDQPSELRLDRESGQVEPLPSTMRDVLAPERTIGFSVTLEDILRAVGLVCSCTRSHLSADTQQRSAVRARALSAWVVRRSSHLTLEQLAVAVGRDATTLSRGAADMARRLTTDSELRAVLTEACRRLADS